jgi:bifunctional lysine-specific demethylase and histidyl-hydroxylase NO66
MLPDRRLGLLGLLNLETLEGFFELTWEREPQLAVGTLRRETAEILTLDQFELLMASATGGESTSTSVVENRVARPVIAGETGSTRLPGLYEAYQRGCTLLQIGLQSRVPTVARICREVENQILAHGIPLAEIVSANGYLTPANAQGFDVHYDNHCALILQIEGTKRWSVFNPIEEMPVARCERAMNLDALGEAVVSAQLETGDVLYIPRGFPHCAWTHDDISLHITLSIRPVIWAEAIKAICQTDSKLRRSARIAFARCIQSDLKAHLSVMDLTTFLQQRVAEVFSNLPPLPIGGLRALDGIAQIQVGTPVTRRPHVVCSATTEASQAVLRFPGAVLRLPAEMQPVFAFIAKHDEFTPAMLPRIEADYDPVELVRILAKRGLLRVHNAGAVQEAV